MTLSSALLPVAVFLMVTGAGVMVVARITRSGPLLHMAHGLTAAGSWIAFAATANAQDLVANAFFGGFAIVSTLLWWMTRRRGRRRRSPRELGHKSRVLIHAMVERMTPSPIPAPGGRAP